jgi:hypothetical protein
MAAPWNPPTRGEDWEGPITLEDASNPGFAKSTPTLAAGDVTISKDHAAFGNVATLPTVAPAASVGVRVQLSATEMTADKVLVHFHDQTVPPEWLDFDISLITTA